MPFLHKTHDLYTFYQPFILLNTAALNIIIRIRWNGPAKDNPSQNTLHSKYKMDPIIYSVLGHPESFMNREMKQNSKFRGSRWKFKRDFYCQQPINSIASPTPNSVSTTPSKTKIQLILQVEAFTAYTLKRMDSSPNKQPHKSTYHPKDNSSPSQRL